MSGAATAYPDLGLAHEQRLLIDGSWVPAGDGEVFPTICPATGEVVANLARARDVDVAAAARAAKAAFRQRWSQVAGPERARLLLEIADVLDGQAERLALIDAVEGGSTLERMRRDVSNGITLLRMFAGLVREAQGRTVPVDADTVFMTEREPFGAVAVIVPFNHPFLFAAHVLGVALAAGNTLVFKPSEHTSLSALALAEVANGILPAGVYNLVTGLGPECGRPLARCGDIGKVHFKGSVRTGRDVMHACADRIVPATMELGGKNPVLVFPDAELDDTVDGLVRAMNLAHQGQSCMFPSRVYVHADVYEEFVQGLAAALAEVRPGPPWLPDTAMGAMVSREQYDRVLAIIDEAVDAGAQVLVGGGAAQVPGLDAGLFIEPTALAEVPPGVTAAVDEIFGPVVCLYRWTDEDDLFARANDSDYGLMASVWTRSLTTAHRSARRLEVGWVSVNNHGDRPHGTPFGGFKQSGIGKERASDELGNYTREKAVLIRL